MALEKDPIYRHNPMWVELGHLDIIKKLYIANDATEIVAEVTSDLSEITEEDALTFGPMYVAYYSEAILHNEDRISIEIEAAAIMGDHQTKERKERGYNPKWLHDERMRFEKALFDAARGDYKGVKAVVAGQWSYEGRPYQHPHAGAFMRIVEIMPDNAAPFTPPRPAWIDFNDLQ